jgi:hypothetical protein
VACEDQKCKINIDSINCAYKGNDNYQASASVAWANGDNARVSIGASQSSAYTDKEFTFSQSTGSGAKNIVATVYDATGKELCSKTGTVKCAFGLPDKLIPSGLESLSIRAFRVSSETEGMEGRRAIDDDQGTEWLSKTGLPQWIWLDLGGVKRIRGVGIFSLYTRPTSLDIKISSDDATYTTVKIVSDVRYDSNGWAKIMFTDTDARYVRVTITSADASLVAIHKIEVYPGIVVEQPGFAIGGLSPVIIIVVVAVAAAGAGIFVFRKVLIRYIEFLTAR